MAIGAGGARQKTNPAALHDQLQTDALPMLEEQIRHRANKIWLEHGEAHGSAEAIWLEAEREILNASKK